MLVKGDKNKQKQKPLSFWRVRKWTRRFTVNGYDCQDEPGGPLGQVFDENQRHQGANHDEVGLLEPQRSFPVNADHADHAEVPHYYCQGEVVHGYVVGFENLPNGKLTNVRKWQTPPHARKPIGTFGKMNLNVR